MTYFLIGLYVFLSIVIASFFDRLDGYSPGDFWLCVFLWPFFVPFLIGVYLADKVKGKK